MTNKEQSPHIVFITSGHHPFSGRLFSNELKSLRGLYDQLTVVGPYEKRESVVDGIRVVGVRKYSSRYNRFSALSELYKTSLANEPDIVHCHEPDSLFVAIKMKKLLPNLKVIYDCHEFHPESFAESFPPVARLLASVAIRAYENRLVAKADAVITVNEKLEERFRQINKRVCVLPNYPRMDFLGKRVRSQEVFSGSLVRLIYAGGLSEDRGLFRMLEATKRVNDLFGAELVLVGKCYSPKIKRRLDSWLADEQTHTKVKYRGYLPHEETLSELLRADVGLILIGGRRRYDWGEPIKYFEYSGAGLPVIMSDLPAKRRLVEENQNGLLVDCKKTTDTVRAVEYLHEHQEDARGMSVRSRRAFLEKYNWERVQERLFVLYRLLNEERNSD